MSTFIVISQGKFDWLQLTLNNLKIDCVVPENIHTPPPAPTEGIGFSRGEGGSICLIFQWGGGGHHREIFPEGSREARRVTKKKQKITTTIYLRRYKT